MPLPQKPTSKPARPLTRPADAAPRPGIAANGPRKPSAPESASNQVQRPERAAAAATPAPPDTPQFVTGEETPIGKIFGPGTLQIIKSTAYEIVKTRASMSTLEKQKKAACAFIAARIDEWREKYPHKAALANRLGCPEFSLVRRQPDPRPVINAETVLAALQKHLPNDHDKWQAIMADAAQMAEFKPFYVIYARGSWSPRSKTNRDENDEYYEDDSNPLGQG